MTNLKIGLACCDSHKLSQIANYHCKDVNSNDLVKLIKGLIKID